MLSDELYSISLIAIVQKPYETHDNKPSELLSNGFNKAFDNCEKHFVNYFKVINSPMLYFDKEYTLLVNCLKRTLSISDKLFKLESEKCPESGNLFDIHSVYLSVLTAPKAGGKASNKIRILGRERKIYKDGRKSYIIYMKQRLSLTEARKLERARRSR